jgi:hypothetical protein
MQEPAPPSSWSSRPPTRRQRIGTLQHVRDFNLSEPAVKAKMKERYGNHVPLDETVISPSAMFDSPLLVTVAEQ